MQNRLKYRLDSILSIKRRFANVVDPNKRQKLINQAMKKRNVQLSALRQHIIEFGHSAHFRRALKSLKRKVDSKPYHTMPNGIKMKDVIKENKERMRLKGRLKQAEQSGSKRITKRVLES